MATVRHRFGTEFHAVPRDSIWHNFYAECGRTVRRDAVDIIAPDCKQCDLVVAARDRRFQREMALVGA